MSAGGYVSHRRWGADRGAALVELALVAPVLLLICFATIDFARAIYTSAGLENAARAGAQYCAANISNAYDTAATSAVVAAASPNITYTSSVSGAACYCATDAGVLTSSSCTATCPSAQHMAVMCTVTASGAYTRVIPYPILPATLSITRAATMRVTH